MIGLEIADIKDFTAKLFLKETFDSFDLVEADFITRFRVSLDGRLTEQDGGAGSFAGWSTVRPLAFQILRGKELPHSFRMVLRLSDENMKKTLEALHRTEEDAGISSFLLNLRYADRKITAVTGCACLSFPPDRALEREWDDMVLRFFRHHGIPVTRI